VREYIKLRRLALACEGLKNKEKRILDIALECGFGGNEVFTKAFKEAYGILPSDYRNDPRPLRNFNKPNLLLSYVMADEGVPLISDGVVIELNRRRLGEPIDFFGFTGLCAKGKAPLGQATGIDEPGEIWKKFRREICKINRYPDGRNLAVSFKGDAPKSCFYYFVGTEVDAGVVDINFNTWRLPAQEYVVCGFEAETFGELVNNVIYKAINYSYSWVEKQSIKTDKFTVEFYYESKLDGAYMELWIPISTQEI